MKIQYKKSRVLKPVSKTVLATSLSAIFTSLILNSAVQASDIEIYQQARDSDVTLMFLLDLSGSMDRNAGGGQNACDLPTGVGHVSQNTAVQRPIVGGPSYSRRWCVGTNGRTYDDRLTRLKDGMMDLLYGNPNKGIERLDDAKVIGLSTFQYSNGTVAIPARRLSDLVGTITQRQVLINYIASSSFTANGRTPTANAYADVGSYMMGSTTRNLTSSGFSSAPSGTVRNSTNYLKPSSLNQREDQKECSGQGIYVLSDGEPNESSPTIAGRLMGSALNINNLSCNTSLLSEVNNPTYGEAGAWSCIGNFSQRLLNKAQNPAGLEIKTAVVGFGSTFSALDDYDKDLSLIDNLKNVNNATIDSPLAEDIRNAARWGIYGQGGWYSGNSSADIVKSVNNFLEAMTTEIPPVTTGSPSVPKDTLDPSLFSRVAYYPQFQPTPDKGYQLWAGNLKKYKLTGQGILADKSGNAVVNSKGELIQGTYDEWSLPTIAGLEDKDDVNLVGTRLFSQKGGVWSQLKLKVTDNLENRKVLTNRIESASKFVSSTTLRQVKVSDLTSGPYQSDANRGYLVSLLGYAMDPTKNLNNAALTEAPELRQIGAIMHSSPLAITNAGKVTYNETTEQMDASDREDYVVFGTTQGLLHVVDAESGVEKFAFVPNEMVENQKEAFLKAESTTGGINKMFYGVDGPWTVYSEYVADSSGKLTVGKGTYNQEGKQLIYGGLRMGGRSYYALNLQDINDPKLQFQISPAEQKVYYNGSSKSFSQLQHMGQSWSKPTIAWVKWGAERKRVMIVGGGYDAGGTDGDARTNSVKGPYDGYEKPEYDQKNGIGAGVYMFDADNGDLLWWASSKATTSPATAESGVIGLKDENLKYSVVSEIRTEDRDSDGLVDHLYFGDLGGQVFRIDVNNKASKLGGFSHKVTRLVDFTTQKSRFYEMPAFSLYDDGGKRFAVLSIGSGNRSLPLKDYTSGYENEGVYNIFDKDVAETTLYDPGYLSKTKDIKIANLTELNQTERARVITEASPAIVSYSRSNGWYYRFSTGTNKQSVKVLATPIVTNYKMHVSTFDGSKPGIAGNCGAGVKGQSFVNLFCMPFGQCTVDQFSSMTEDEKGCAEAGGCDLGPGLQNSNVIPIDPPNGGSGGSGGFGGTFGKKPNANYCIATGNLAVTKAGAPIPSGETAKCLIPQRWYEVFKQ